MSSPRPRCTSNNRARPTGPGAATLQTTAVRRQHAGAASTPACSGHSHEFRQLLEGGFDLKQERACTPRSRGPNRAMAGDFALKTRLFGFQAIENLLGELVAAALAVSVRARNFEE